MAKKEVKSIFGSKKLQKINNETPPPDKRDYLEEYFEHDLGTKESQPITPASKEEEPVQPINTAQEEKEADPKVYKSYYALASSHEAFRDIVYTLRQKVDADLNNGEVFDRMLEYYREYVENTHGALLKAKPPKRGRR